MSLDCILYALTSSVDDEETVSSTQNDKLNIVEIGIKIYYILLALMVRFAFSLFAMHATIQAFY